jgi:hypothetical protein
MRSASALLAAAAIGASILAGCGGSSFLGSGGAGGSGGSGGSGGPASTGQLTAAQWKVKVNSICSAMTAKTNALVKPTRASQLKPYVQKILDLAHSEIAQLQAIKAPAQFAAGQRAVVSDLSTVFAGLQSLLKKPLTATTFAATLRSPAALRAARDYVERSRAAGLPSCVLTNGT